MDRKNRSTSASSLGATGGDSLRILDVLLREIEYTCFDLEKVQKELDERPRFNEELWGKEFQLLVSLSSLTRKYERILNNCRHLLESQDFEKKKKYIHSLSRSGRIEL